METIIDKRFKCPICKTSEFIKKFADDGCYVCKNYNGKERQHEKPVAIICKKCNKQYEYSRFGEKNMIYECKECGQTQWGLSDFQKDYRSWLLNDRHSKI